MSDIPNPHDTGTDDLELRIHQLERELAATKANSNWIDRGTHEATVRELAEARDILRRIDVECRQFGGDPPMYSRWARIKQLAASGGHAKTTGLKSDAERQR